MALEHPEQHHRPPAELYIKLSADEFDRPVITVEPSGLRVYEPVELQLKLFEGVQPGGR